VSKGSGGIIGLGLGPNELNNIIIPEIKPMENKVKKKALMVVLGLS
jgi:hypothetical protein